MHAHEYLGLSSTSGCSSLQEAQGFFLERVIMAMKSSMSTKPSRFLSIFFTISLQSSRLQLSPSLCSTCITSSALILPSPSWSNTKNARRMSPSGTPLLCTSMNSSKSM
ncbi:Os09g0458600 [Oryza sativa Japonica Group]|uniref:Os09g0458600 protein n=2 Tax=Oryza sativa subsp. japonica TaxID=39947 RepID=Q0J173_ORYSJ|nr:hypothetical protein EE612_048299 [Oryza sativa]BAF25292.1 Os09g0458600 [Oryza sativa Japonica Group]BAT08456.1 Os09g0458600 [Oryza sativa Japonica Group]|eukprot:NP_001063378.1 Os09g0458600 [Oryza sativa Japonica Group]